MKGLERSQAGGQIPRPAEARREHGSRVRAAIGTTEAAAVSIPQWGGNPVRAEIECAAGGLAPDVATLGERKITASLGPGLSLMQEGDSFQAGSELPFVIVDVMRGSPGPSSATAELFDKQRNRGGGHTRCQPYECRENIPAPDFEPGYRNWRTKIAGFEGQGVLFLGRLLAQAGMHQGYHVSWLSSYGLEIRGGIANCLVSISTQPIGSQLVSHPTVLIALNKPSLDRFEPEVTRGGLIMYDSSLIATPPTRTDVDIIALPATAMADEVGRGEAANMVALGAFMARTGLPGQTLVFTLLERWSKDPLVKEWNLRAVGAGLRYVREAA